MKYLNHVADRYDLRRDIRLKTSVVSAVYDDGARRWRVTSTGSDGGQVTTARYCIMATGCLSSSRVPDFPGLKDSLEEYVAGRRERGLTLRVVRSPARDIPLRWPTSHDELRVARYAPPDYLFTMTMIIGKNAVAVMSSSREAFAMMIDSREFAQTQASLFELLWAASTPAEKADADRKRLRNPVGKGIGPGAGT